MRQPVSTLGSLEQRWGGAVLGGLITTGGIALAPLGYSMAGAGATWALTTAIVNEDDTMPWIEIASGAVVFLASFLISTALDGVNPVKMQMR